MKISFIGGGNMGEAFVSTLCEKQIFKPSEILVIERNQDKRKKFEEKYSVKTSKKIEDIAISEIIFLAIKPQNLEDLPVFEFSNKIIISILAGMKISKISEKFPNSKIVRTMPNLGQFVGFGMTGIFFDENFKFSEKEKKRVKNIFESGGQIVEVSKEDDMDKIGAISGSGPAYFFYFTEVLSKISQDLGFDKKSSEILARQTLLGAAEILKQNYQDSPTLWRERVTSKKGITEAALNEFFNSEFEVIFTKALKKNIERGKELGE